jgi:hypothetical protein
MHMFRKPLIVLSTLSVGLLGLALPASAASRQTIPHSQQKICTHPRWSTSGPGGGRSGPGIIHPGNSPYINDNDMWNAAGYDVSQTMYVCSHASWYVDDTIPADTNSAVKTYPNVHVDYRNWCTGYQPLLSSYKKITSSYAGRAPRVGVYDVAYDIWLNGVGTPGSNEVMIWTQAKVQSPVGYAPEVASNVTLSGRTWDLYAMPSNSYLAFVPANGQSYPSGTLDLTAFFNYLIRQGHIQGNSTLGAIDYGIEVVSTGGGTTRFDVTNFSVNPPHRAVESC